MKPRVFPLFVLIAVALHANVARADCDAGGVCAECAKDSDCAANQFCEAQTNMCTAKLADGTALPVGDTCDAITAARECITGECDPASNECGPPAVPKPVDAGTTSASDAGLASDAASGANAGITSGATLGDAGPSYEVGGGCDVARDDVDAGRFAFFAIASAGAIVIASRRKKNSRR